MHSTNCILYVLLTLSFFITSDADQNCTSEIFQLQQKVTHLSNQVAMAYSKPTVPTTNCTLTHFEFPRPFQTEDFVWYRGYFPRLKSATMCAWFKVTDLSHNIVFASYATNTNSDHILVIYDAKSTLHVYMQDHHNTFEFNNPEKLNHLCFWFDSNRAVIGFYINGEELPSQGYPGYIVPGGGSLILGQEQDSVNAGHLDPSQCFSGTIDNFMIWPRVLSHVEVLRMGGLGQCPVDHAVAMTTDRVEMWGENLYSVPTECPLLTV